MIYLTFLLALRCVSIWAVENQDYEAYDYEVTNSSHFDIYNSLSSIGEGGQPVRKCCPDNEFYNTLIQECEKILNSDTFYSYVTDLLIRSRDVNLSPITKKIKVCPQTLKQPKNVVISGNSSHHLFENGSVFDRNENRGYNITHYCLEMVGNDISSSVLLFVYCPSQEYFIPKCCPRDHYFDNRINNCSTYYFSSGSEGDSSLIPYISPDYFLQYHYLICRDPIVITDLRDTIFIQDSICLENIENCFSTDKYCIDNYLEFGETSLYPVAFLCPDYFINKCCPDEQSLYEGGCIASKRRSLSVLHMLKNHKYQIKSTSEQGSECSPIIIEDETRSGISWEVNSYGLAIIKNGNSTIQTRNYCIDDYLTADEVLPVITVCSEEVKEYHQVSSIDKWENVSGKCCPLGTWYDPNATEGQFSPTCIKEEELGNHSLDDSKTHLPKLIYGGFPSCESEKEFYHFYKIGNVSRDYAELTSERTLRVVNRENECRTKETILSKDKFCLDFMVYKEGLKTVAIVCAPSTQTPHPERNSMIISFIGVSCIALVLTFFSLIFMRVRRGMVTMKKINTLAGRILISYVSAQLLSFVSLSVGVLVDFREEVHLCSMLGALILFFSVASFCWNTSICFEGLLLTLHVNTRETRRFLCHCLWAWGVPALITMVALVMDARREDLPCDAITPKFGIEQCFFSDLVAKILYFFVPISATIVLNGVFLVSAKIIRRRQLKELEKDPHRIRRHGTLKKVFTNRKSIKEEKKMQNAAHSGLRTHQFQNVWIETTRLGLWSGITWIMELVGAVITLQVGPSQAEWYQYLWYIPVCFNCLRGVGISIIIVLTPDNKTRVMRTMKNMYSSVFQSHNLASSAHHMRAHSKKSLMKTQSRTHDQQRHEGRERGVSVSTVLTYLSGTQSESEKRPVQYCHSVSQIDLKLPSYSSGLSDVFEVGEETAVIVPQNSVPKVANLDEGYWSVSIEDMTYCTHL